MIPNDYSQLPVMNGPRNLLGAVGWESIARARMHKPEATLRDAIVPVGEVYLEDEVLRHVPEIIERGLVFVRQADRKVCGVVTTTDLSVAFQDLAEPFLLVGDVERLLRRIIVSTFDLPHLQAARDPKDTSRTIESVEDLTPSPYVALPGTSTGGSSSRAFRPLAN